MTDPVIVLDFETTGLSPREGARPTEIAAVVVENDSVTRRFSSLMNPGIPIPIEIQRFTGISDSMVQGAPTVAEVMRRFFDFIGDIPLVAHNASFDRQFLDWEFTRLGIQREQPVLCTMQIARRVYPLAPNHKLATLVDFLGLPMNGTYHRAEADAEVTAKLWVAMKNEVGERCRLSAVSSKLMANIQSAPRKSMKSHWAMKRQVHRLMRRPEL